MLNKATNVRPDLQEIRPEASLPYEHIPQLRILPNSYCGRKCFYCRPAGESIVPASKSVELGPDECLAAADAYADLGGQDIKFSGGDPVFYADLVNVVERIRETTAIRNIEILSRHPRFAALASDLAQAGATLFNVSLDTLSPERHLFITGVNDHADVLAMIRTILNAGHPMKINMVVARGVNEDEIVTMAEWCGRRGILELKLLDLIQDLDESGRAHALSRGFRLRDYFVSLDRLIAPLQESAVKRYSATQGGLGHPMLGIVLPSGLRVLVKDHTYGAWYAGFCRTCRYFPCHDAVMALRVTSDFSLQPCLLNGDMVVPLADRNGSLDRVGMKMRRFVDLFDHAQFHSFSEEN